MPGAEVESSGAAEAPVVAVRGLVVRGPRHAAASANGEAGAPDAGATGPRQPPGPSCAVGR